MILERRREAIEEIRRNGFVISPEGVKSVDDVEPELPALNVRDIDRDNLVWPPDARPMGPENIVNVESLTAPLLAERLAGIASILGKYMCAMSYAEFQQDANEWTENDFRWTLSPPELKKLMELAYFTTPGAGQRLANVRRSRRELATRRNR